MGKLILVLMLNAAQVSLGNYQSLGPISEDILDLDDDYGIAIITFFPLVFLLSCFSRSAYGYLCIHSVDRQTEVKSDQIQSAYGHSAKQLPNQSKSHASLFPDLLTILLQEKKETLRDETKVESERSKLSRSSLDLPSPPVS